MAEIEQTYFAERLLSFASMKFALRVAKTEGGVGLLVGGSVTRFCHISPLWQNFNPSSWFILCLVKF